MAIIGIIGGSGLYQIDGITDVEWRHVWSPFGEPSDELCFGKLGDTQVVFLPRHGRGHKIPPSEINFRANIDALKRSGVTDLISLSAVGSLNIDLPPGTFVLADQFIDRTFARPKTFFGKGCVAHVSMAHPVCHRLGEHLAHGAEAAGFSVKRGGTYIVMEGPQFSTMAESNLYRSWNCDVIGMTNMPEAKLAREAEICYATVAMVTDYDCWHEDHEAVTVSDIIANLQQNAGNACKVVAAAVRAMPESRACKCGSALAHALITDPKAIPPLTREKLDLIAGKYLA
jgi:5'-methylthioadenosine phosphorylase